MWSLRLHRSLRLYPRTASINSCKLSCNLSDIQGITRTPHPSPYRFFTSRSNVHNRLRRAPAGTATTVNAQSNVEFAGEHEILNRPVAPVEGETTVHVRERERQQQSTEAQLQSPSAFFISKLEKEEAPEGFVRPQKIPSIDAAYYIHDHRIAQTPLPTWAPNFQQLHIQAHVYTKLPRFHITMPTLIQAATIPHLNRRPHRTEDGKYIPSGQFPDLLVTDYPASGKTFAYLLPMLSQINPHIHALQGIIITPTRELAIQLAGVIQDLTEGGEKARKINPIRTELAVGDVNPSLCSSLTKPAGRSKELLPPLEPEYEDNEPDDKLSLAEMYKSSPVPHILIGQANTLNELLCRMKLIDTSQLKYIVADDIDELLVRRDSRAYISPLLALRTNVAEELLSPIKSSPSPFVRLPTPNHTPEELKILEMHPRTQVIGVSSSLTPDVFNFAKNHFSKFQHLISPLSISEEVERRGRPIRVIPKTNDLASYNVLLDKPRYVKHYFITTTRSLPKPLLVVALVHAIRTEWARNYRKLEKIEVVDPPVLPPHNTRAYKHWLTAGRRERSVAYGGMAAIPPHENRTQTTIIYFKNTKELFPLLSPISATNLRISMITSQTSRSQRRAALKPGATDVLLVSDELRGLNIKTATHIINYDVPRDDRCYYNRCGRVGRLGGVHVKEATVITMIETTNREAELTKLLKISSDLGMAPPQLMALNEEELLVDQPFKPRRRRSVVRPEKLLQFV